MKAVKLFKTKQSYDENRNTEFCTGDGKGDLSVDDFVG